MRPTWNLRSGAVCRSQPSIWNCAPPPPPSVSFFWASAPEPVPSLARFSPHSCVSMEGMHDLSYFRANFERIAERLATRGNVAGLDQFRELDQSRRTAITRAEQLKARVNEQSAEIGKRRREGADTTAEQEQVRAMKVEIAALDEQVKSLDGQFQELLGGIPNVPHESVPAGKTAEDNVEVRRVGQPTRFDFEPKAHWDLGPERSEERRV